MLDLKWIRENAEEVQQAARNKGMDISIADLLAWDERKRKLLQQTEELRRQRNKLADEIGRMVKGQTEQSRDILRAEKDESGDAWGRQTGELRQQNKLADEIGRTEESREVLLAQAGKSDALLAVRNEAKRVGAELAALEPELGEATEQLLKLCELVPNIVSPDTPIGASDEDNVEQYRVGAPPVFDFAARDHMQLGELHSLIDAARGVKVSGSRFYYLKGAGMLLHRAVQQLALDMLLEQGFTPLEVPLMVRPETMLYTGFFPTGQDQAYPLEEGARYLVGTSEVPLVAYYAGEIVDVGQPIKLAAASTCFRSEVGSAGRDVHGLYRVHQFAKVEQVVICRADPAHSEELLQQITANAERLLQLLELPYRRMAVCTGDMSQKTYKQYDLETWMPSRDAYGETHSSSNLHDFQARRSNIRYRDDNGALRYCHTLNNTAAASPRILIPLLENHQREDGSIHIPEALRPYMNGMAELAPLLK